MNVSLYQAASALHAMDRWQETIAENLASSSVPGFKKQDFSFAAVQAGLHAAPAMGASRAVLMTAGQANTNFKPGEFRVTNGRTDVAIDGRAFFEVQLPNGTSQGADLKGRLRLTEFANPNLLTRLSGGYFTAENANVNASPSTSSTLRQGMLEEANTSVVMEMANLISAMRTFEANQRMAQIHDDRIARTLSDLGNVS